MRIFRTLAPLTAACAALGACAHYDAKPVAPERFADGYDARRLNPPPGGVWDDAALLSAAVVHSPSLRAAEASYRAARAAAKASRTPPQISLTLVAEYSRDAGGASPWLYSGLFNIPLDYGTKRSARLDAADLATLQALYDYADAIWTVRNAIVHAHVQRLAADREAVLAQEALRLRQDRVRKLEQRIRAGEDARPTGLIAAVELAAAERRAQDLLNQRAAADAALATAIGVPIAAVQSIVLQPLPDAVAAISAANLAVLRQQASLKRRDVLRTVADYDAAEQGLRLEVAKQYPDIQLGPGYTFERGQHKIPFDLTLVLPPRDLNQANIKSAEAKRALAGAKLDAAQAAVLTGIDQASSVLTGARAGLDRIVTRDLPLALRADAGARRALAAGEVDRTEQEAAEGAVIDVQLAAIDGWRAAWLAVADLEDALRRPSPNESAVLEAAVKQAGDTP